MRTRKFILANAAILATTIAAISGYFFAKKTIEPPVEVEFVEVVQEREQCSFKKKLNAKQRENLSIIKTVAGDKDLARTLAAIAWRESHLGVNLVRHNVQNIRDNSFGMFQKVLFWEAQQTNESAFALGVKATRLITDPAHATAQAIKDLQGFIKLENGDVMAGLARYNGRDQYGQPNFKYAAEVMRVAAEIAECEM
ncbi:MAG: hypothetical protein ACRCWB_11880 [Enterovibrio sp.]